ncbi:MAG: ABC transporter permease [Christensenellales bacterium]
MSIESVGLVSRKPTQKPIWKRIIQFRWMYVFLLPAIIWYAIFAYGPIYFLQIAFRDYKIIRGVYGSEWVGFKFFEAMFTDNYFWTVLWNTLKISSLKLIFVAPSGLFLALILNEVFNKPFKGFVQSCAMLPHFFSWVVIASIMKEIFALSTGMVNEIISAFGGERIYFMVEKGWFLFLLIASDVWESAGWNSIMFMAAIAAIPPDLYEAASIDGATRGQQLRHVTLPGIANTIVIIMILKVGSVMDAGFGQIFNLYNDAVRDSVDIIDTYVYRMGILGSKYSASAAVGLFKNVINLILVLTVNHVAKMVGQETLF